MFNSQVLLLLAEQRERVLHHEAKRRRMVGQMQPPQTKTDG